MRGNQENPGKQSVKCFSLAAAQFPTDESDDPETGGNWRQINRIAKSIFNQKVHKQTGFWTISVNIQKMLGAG